ncbi:hypothetical protein DNTS_002671 [Danionella cerebrum]|uniref:Uncharacterized protein n=1 Tax=Danionella cerebrum TaxID=2873325 RepID=A0A553QKQ3_9TELE|nr:hypothetical protein DNTS_002671 [Danionella translucida]
MPKIHVFLGAPCPQTLSEDVEERTSPHWNKVDLIWKQGKLLPKDTSTVSADVLGGTGDKTETSQDDSTPSVGEQDPSKAVEEQELCPISVSEYLDRCFSSPTKQNKDERPISPVSTETEYLSTWTKSQVLFSRVPRSPASGLLDHSSFCSPQTPFKPTSSASVGSPELYSPAVSPDERGYGGTLQSSGEWHDSHSQRQQERGLILEITSDGILCSQVSAVDDQEDFRHHQSSPSATFSKMIKISHTVTKEKSEQRKTTIVAPLHGSTTLLARCKTHGIRYAILVAVVHPCHLKEIQVKTGPSAGTSVPLATLVVTDQSDVEMKVVLWRTAAFWTLTVYPGDILLITDVSVHIDKWRSETVLQSSFTSKLLNMGQITRERIPIAPQNLNCHTLRGLCTHLCEKRPLLVSLPPHKPQDLNSIVFIRLGALHKDTLVHALLKVKHSKVITAWRDEVNGASRVGGVLKAILTVKQADGQQGAVVLWGAALSWLQRLEKNRDAVWEFRLLLVKQDVISGLLELHSTPWSTCHPLFPDDNRCKDFYNTLHSQKTTTCFEIDLRTLLSQKYSGNVELKCKITAFQFQSAPSQESPLLLDGRTPLEEIMSVVSGDVTFSGCGLCTAELEMDENGIYRPCYPCLPQTGVRRYYRPVVLTARDGDKQICVKVPSSLVQKILLDTPPDKLHKFIAAASEVKFLKIVADRIGFLLNPMNLFLLTVRSQFQCDENSIPLIQDFLLLELSSTGA